MKTRYEIVGTDNLAYERQNFYKMLLKFWHSVNLALVNRKISSAKNRWDIQIWPQNPIRWIFLS